MDLSWHRIYTISQSKLTFSESISIKLVNFDTVLCFTKTEKVNTFWNQLYHTVILIKTDEMVKSVDPDQTCLAKILWIITAVLNSSTSLFSVIQYSW